MQEIVVSNKDKKKVCIGGCSVRLCLTLRSTCILCQHQIARFYTELGRVSLAIEMISSSLEIPSREAGPPIPVQPTAPTRLAVHGIHSRMLHGLFRLSIDAHFEARSPQNRRALQNTFKVVRHLTIDESSIIDLQQLSWIHRWCQEIFSGSSGLPFCGPVIVLSGGFSQLLPVRQTSQFFMKGGNRDTQYGR